MALSRGASSSSGGGGGAGGSAGSSKGTPVNLAFDSNLRSSLAHLPPALNAALVNRDIPPQNIVLQVTRSTGGQFQSKTAQDGDENDANKLRDTIFLGWTGHSSNTESTLVLSSSLAHLFEPAASSSSHSSATYSLTLLRSPPLPTATRVDLTPLTPDDWELLSQNAGAVEDNMLSQVRGVSTGGRVCIFVGRSGGQECWFQVDSTEPPTEISAPSSSKGKAAARAVRLTTDTEIVIAPRTRQSAAAAAAEQSHDLGSAAASFSTSSAGQVNATISARDRVKNRIYKVLPAEARPEAAAQMFDIDGDVPIAVVSDDGAASDWSLLSTAFAAKQDAGWARATVTVQPCPSAQSIRPQTSAGSSQKKPGTSSQKAESNVEGAHSSTPGPRKSTATAYIVAAEPSLWYPRDNQRRAWPQRWVWMNSPLRRKLGGLGLGESIAFAVPPPGSSASAPPLATLQKQSIPEDRSATSDEPAGIASLLDEVDERLTSSLSPLASGSSGESRNMLLHGPSGVGKTMILQTIASRLHARLVTTLFVDCTPLSEMRISQLKTTFKEWRDALDWYSYGGPGAVLMLDNLDKVLIAEVENVDPTRARTIAECFVQMMSASSDASASSVAPSVVLATASSSTSLHKLLMEKHVWSDSIAIKPPGKTERGEILAHLVSRKATAKDSGLEADASLNFVLLAAQTEGYLPADLVDLVDRAIYCATMRAGKDANEASTGAKVSGAPASDSSSQSSPLSLTLTDFNAAQENFTPISLRSLSLSSSGSTSWASIGGLHETRRVLRETLEFPSRYAPIFASCPLRLRSGLLLYGYPGCGKTMLASAVAKECGCNFVSVKGPELLNKYIGASEKSVRDLFERASAAKPCVLFFDEFDSIAPKRGHDSTGVTDRVVNQLLTQMDGAEGLSGVYVLAATSRPDLIDSALLRPGRLDKSLLCDMPSLSDRIDIFKAVVGEGKIGVDESQVDWKEWAEKTAGYSGADLQALVYNAHLEVIHEGLNVAEAVDESTHDGVNGQNAQQAKDDQQAQLRFVELRGNDSKTSKDAAATTAQRRSGAEEQALRRRIELALSNAKTSRASSAKTQRGSNDDVDERTHGESSSKATVSRRAKGLITSRHLAQSLSSMRPSVPETECRRLSRIYADFAGDGSGRPAEFGSGEASRDVGARQSLM